MIIQLPRVIHKPVCLLSARWPDHTSAMALDGHGMTQDHVDKARGCSPRPPTHRGKAVATSWPAPTPLLRSTERIQTLSASNHMLTSMPTET
jgi:hypothetical protein